MGNPVYTGVRAEQISDAITELALDLRWSWNHATDEVWRELEPELWEATQNPWLILQSVSHERLRRLLALRPFQERVEALLDDQRRLHRAGAWFQASHGDSMLDTVAYFSMEYMLTEALPIYAGGLGNVAGDLLKAASDLGVPVVAVGLLYQQGYFRQEIDPRGAQIARYPFNDPGQLPIRPLRTEGGDWLRMRLSLPGHELWLRAWEARVGRLKLYLLDTNDPANLPAHRGITGELYGGGAETRLLQELVLGLGGWRLLRALGLQPQVCHLNEGHTAFAILERARSFMEDHQQPFAVALAATRAGNLFTTHTAVDAGFDRFPPALIGQYLRLYAEQRLKIPLEELLGLGRRDPADGGEPFNMAYLAMRGSGAVNGVSRLHGQVSRRLFSGLFPRWPEPEVPVGHVTNGVHVPTWDSAEADTLWEEACGRERWRGPLECAEKQVRAIDDAALWRLRSSTRRALVEFARRHIAEQRASEAATQQELDEAARLFDPDRLTLGFARRFATYKRPNMLLHDPERLVRILTNPERPVQLFVAGKAHPADPAGQAMIQEWNRFVRRPDVQGHTAFLSDYDMLLTHELVEGVDLWVNTPRRPWEACGTSGMKILANGGLNLSELDGWWAEAYCPEVGWALGDGKDRGEDRAWDVTEAEALYQLLENEIVPAFYNRDARGIPTGWLARIRESMARLTPLFSANRMVRQYTEEYYHPLASTYRARTADGGRPAARLLEWQNTIASKWHELRFVSVEIDARGGKYHYRVDVDLGSIRPDEVQVEIYAEPRDSEAPFRAPLDLAGPAGPPGRYVYAGAVPDERPTTHYTARAIPRRDGALIPLERPLIAWQR